MAEVEKAYMAGFTAGLKNSAERCVYNRRKDIDSAVVYECSRCKTISLTLPHFCPNCGAFRVERMEN